MSAVVRMKLNICKNKLHALILCENRATEINADLLYVPLAASFHSTGLFISPSGTSKLDC